MVNVCVKTYYSLCTKNSIQLLCDFLYFVYANSSESLWVQMHPYILLFVNKQANSKRKKPLQVLFFIIVQDFILVLRRR